MTKKIKYDASFKLKCIELVLKSHQSIYSVAQELGFSDGLLHKWLNDYKAYGSSGLIAKSSKRIYSAEFKLNVLKTIEKHHLTLSEAGIRFKIPNESIIVKWRKDFTNFGVDGLQPKPKGRFKNMITPKGKAIKSKQPLTREEELLLENERLRCENALLKKFNALIQAEEEKLKKLGRKP